PDAAETSRFGEILARSLPGEQRAPLILYFEGGLGAGKTSLIRGLLAGLGHAGRVPSPTYTLVEPYALERYRVLHVDLYRLRDPTELDDLGIDDELAAADDRGRGSVLLAEWPGRGGDRLPEPDLVLHLAIDRQGRKVSLSPRTSVGEELLSQMQQALPGGF
ncbi:MAG: tRNA (adenosine(37)-N6)-threonylcarbamoyltransferase complex ATPase subunit type 1 TsaE, partial [Gammaproteobacteria bacterium]|nr:tRNA (adenosine(37)-N6)-threonylcarbamoyltransferase complex ATPase subunit type 1 TsaE [Gammaproteobacteria bacterium]